MPDLSRSAVKRVDKAVLLEEVLNHLRREFDTLTRAANEARGEATHAESKQENKYDTRGLEASYLASGQSKRAIEVGESIDKLKSVPMTPLAEGEAIRPGALVEVERQGATLKYFLLPFVGGMTVGGDVKVVSTVSPLGKEMLGRQVDDEFTFNGQAHLIEAIL